MRACDCEELWLALSRVQAALKGEASNMVEAEDVEMRTMVEDVIHLNSRKQAPKVLPRVNVSELPVFVIFIHGFGCNSKGGDNAESSVQHWMNWTKDNVGDDVRKEDVVGFCNPDNMKIFRAVIRSTIYHRPQTSTFINRVTFLTAMKLATHRVVLMGDSYGGGIANSVAKNLQAHENIMHLGVRTFGATYVPFNPPAHMVDWINFMFVDDMAVELNRLAQPDPSGNWHVSFDAARRVMWVQTGYPRVSRTDMMGGRMVVHRQYGALYKAILSRSELRYIFSAGTSAATALKAEIHRIGVRDKDAFKKVVGFGRPPADPEVAPEPVAQPLVRQSLVRQSLVRQPSDPRVPDKCPICLEYLEGPVVRLTCGGSGEHGTMEACTKGEIDREISKLADSEGTTVRLLNCRHGMHAECLLQHLRVGDTNKCPVCDKAIAVGSPVKTVNDPSFLLQNLQRVLFKPRRDYRRALQALYTDRNRFPQPRMSSEP